MRVVLITSRYPPETSPGAKRASDLAASLRSSGHRVTVITQVPNYPDPSAFAFPAPPGNAAAIEEDGAGNATWRFAPRTASRGDLGGRLLAEARFAFLASRAWKRLPAIDGVIASTPFVFNLLAARSRRAPSWLDLRDLTWEYARVLGPRSPLKGMGAIALRSLALSCFRRASGISTTTEAQRRYLIDRGLPEDKVRVVPNGVPRKVIEDLGRRSAAAESGGVPVKVIYAGLLGFPQGLGFAVEAVETMAEEGIELHLFGEGVDRPRLAGYCRDRRLRHVAIHGQIPFDAYLQALSTADVLLASLRPEVEAAVPSKLLEYMAAGKPILFIGSGEAAEAVERAGAGRTVPFGDRALFQDRLRELARDPGLRSRLGACGREWVARHRVREDINRSWVREIEEAFGGRAARSAAGGPSGAADRRPARRRGRIGALQRLAGSAARGTEAAGLLRLLEWILEGPPGGLRALVYHRVAEPDARPHLPPGLLSATPAEFARQMDFLATRYRVVSMGDVLRAARGDGTLPPRAVLLSFDDAYRDFADHAWPILRRRGLPVALFVPTAFPDDPGRAFWWDRLFGSIAGASADRIEAASRGTLGSAGDRMDVYRRLRDRIKEMPHAEGMALVDRLCRDLGEPAVPPAVLGWDELRSLAGEGVTLGAHTRTHPIVDRIPAEEARAEVQGSMEDLKREIGSTPPIFAYPSGRCDDGAVRVVAEAGLELAFTTGGDIADLGGDRLRIPRIPVGARTTRAALRAQLVGIRAPSWLRR